MPATKVSTHGERAIVLESADGFERRVLPAVDGAVTVEVWQRVSAVTLTADDVALLYALAERTER